MRGSLSELTRSAILSSQKVGSTKYLTEVYEVKGKPHNFQNNFLGDHYILLLKHLSNHMHFITNAFKRFKRFYSPNRPIQGNASL